MQLFNERRFFEAHDVLEDVWQGLRGPARSFVQGLIQVAVGFHHLERGNPPGAASVFARALARLRPYAPRAWGFDVARHVGEIEQWHAYASGTREAPGAPPVWSFGDALSSEP